MIGQEVPKQEPINTNKIGNIIYKEVNAHRFVRRADEIRYRFSYSHRRSFQVLNTTDV